MARSKSEPAPVAGSAEPVVVRSHVDRKAALNLAKKAVYQAEFAFASVVSADDQERIEAVKALLVAALAHIEETI